VAVRVRSAVRAAAVVAVLRLMLLLAQAFQVKGTTVERATITRATLAVVAVLAAAVGMGLARQVVLAVRHQRITTQVLLSRILAAVVLAALVRVEPLERMLGMVVATLLALTQ